MEIFSQPEIVTMDITTSGEAKTNIFDTRRCQSFKLNLSFNFSHLIMSQRIPDHLNTDYTPVITGLKYIIQRQLNRSQIIVIIFVDYNLVSHNDVETYKASHSTNFNLHLDQGKTKVTFIAQDFSNDFIID